MSNLIKWEKIDLTEYKAIEPAISNLTLYWIGRCKEFEDWCIDLKKNNHIVKLGTLKIPINTEEEKLLQWVDDFIVKNIYQELKFWQETYQLILDIAKLETK
jgi:hypothetical protein